MIEWQLTNNNEIKYVDFIRKYVNPDEYCLLVCGSYGDVIITLAFIDSFIKNHKSSLVVVIDQKFNNYCKRFKRNDVRFVYVSSEYLFRNSIIKFLQPLNLIKGFIFPTLPTLHPLLVEAIYSRRIEELEARRLILGLPFRSPLSFPEITIDNISLIDDIFKKLNLRKGRTFVISPNSNTLAFSFHDDLWSKLVLILKKFDYDVIFNVADDKSKIKYDSNLTIELLPEFCIEFIQYAGNYLGLTHGLTSLLSLIPSSINIIHLIDTNISSLNNNGIIVNPDNHSIFKGTLCHEIIRQNNINELFINLNIDNDFNDLISIL